MLKNIQTIKKQLCTIISYKRKKVKYIFLTLVKRYKQAVGLFLLLICKDQTHKNLKKS